MVYSTLALSELVRAIPGLLQGGAVEDAGVGSGITDNFLTQKALISPKKSSGLSFIKASG
jgi:hypothetical protein